MAKGYWIAHIDVKDTQSYPQYIAAASEALAQFGGNIIVRGGPAEVKEGSLRARHVVIEFPTIETAYECYNSETYRKALAMRNAFADSDLVIVEGAG